MINSDIIITESSRSKVNAKVELYDGSTLVETCTCNDRLQDFKIERSGQNKFFGFGIYHKLTVTLIDLERNLTVSKGNSFKVYFGYETFINPYPTFYASEVTRDETTNSITIVAYDKLYTASEHTVGEVLYPYTIKAFVEASERLLGVSGTVFGKNLWNNDNYNSNATDDYLTKTDTGFIFNRNGSTRGFAVYYSISVKAGETYTFSYNSGEYPGQLYIYHTQAYGDILMQTNETSVTYMFEEDITAVFAIILPNTIDVIEASNIQIEKNTARTSYEPYLSVFNANYETGANFEGEESYKDGLTAAAEATQTIFYMNNEDKLVFKRLDRDGDPVLTITKDDYYDMESGESFTLATIANTDELNDVTTATIGEGTTQFVRDNPFWELRTDDIGTLLDNAAAAVCGTSINQFYCNWDGNFLLEPGDKISLVTEDGGSITSYLITNTISYAGTLEEETSWEYEDEGETAENPTSLGEVLKQTYAKVDKANKEITLVASQTENNTTNISNIIINTDGITSTVSSLQVDAEALKNDIETLEEKQATLEETVSTKLTSTEFDIRVTEKLSTGVDEIKISETGFTFDKTGLNITKTDSEMKTNIDEDGLSVFKNDEEVLTADNTGVKAKNLNATTYLYVGGRSSFANYDDEYGTERTGCFWIGN